MSFIAKDWGDLIFDKLTLAYYEWLQRKERKSMDEKKKKFIENNVVVVTVNGEKIYDSSVDGIMNDDLYNALISYGAKEDIKEKSEETVIYNLNPSVTSFISQ